MPRTTNPKILARMIESLRSQRQDLLAKLKAIDSAFEELGINPDGARRGPGRPAAATGVKGRRGGRRKRGRFDLSGEESVLNFVKKAGRPNAAEVNKHWSGEGRGGKADNALGKLVRVGKLKRVEVKGERGARYVAA